MGGIEEFCQPQMGSTKEGNNLKRESRHSKKNETQYRGEEKGREVIMKALMPS